MLLFFSLSADYLLKNLVDNQSKQTNKQTNKEKPRPTDQTTDRQTEEKTNKPTNNSKNNNTNQVNAVQRQTAKFPEMLTFRSDNYFNVKYTGVVNQSSESEVRD